MCIKKDAWDKVNKRYIKRIKRWAKSNNGCYCIVGSALFIFPLLVGLIYALPLPQIVAVSSESLLAYYGTAFGLLGSFITYRLEQKKNIIERRKEIKPVFWITVKKVDQANDVFEIKIINNSVNPLSYLCLYDEFVTEEVKKIQSFRVTYDKTREALEGVQYDHNISQFNDIDTDGYPKYVQIICDDCDGNTWDCCFEKINDSKEIYYYPREIIIP